MPQTIPREPGLDATLRFVAEGYDFIGERCRRFGSDIFQTRLLGRRVYCLRGAEAARMFYEPDRMTRNGAIPKSMLKLLQDEGSVATLDGAAHRRRKAMFLALMTPERLADMARRSAEALRARAATWPGRERVVLHPEFREILSRAICDWAGVPADDREAARLAHESGAMIDHAPNISPANWRARLLRRRSERFLRGVFERIRAGEIDPPDGSGARVIATHRDTEGRLLDPEVCAVEMLNLIRPTVAVARFMAFALRFLHGRPQDRERLAADDAFLEAFAQEVRRISPFFAIVGGVARGPFAWRDWRFEAGDRFILDLHGTGHEARVWPEPDAFRPERFLDWKGDPCTMIPQGGGDHHANHRCAGEWLTIEVMKAMLRTLAREIDYEVPPQDLRVDTRRLPALPASGFVVTNVRLREAGR